MCNAVARCHVLHSWACICIVYTQQAYTHPGAHLYPCPCHWNMTGLLQRNLILPIKSHQQKLSSVPSMWLRWVQSMLHSSALCLGCATFLTHHTHHCKQFYSGYHQALLFSTNTYLVVTVVYLDKPCIYIVDYSKPPRRWIRQKMGGSFGSNGEIWWGWTKKTSNKHHHSVKPFWNGTPSRIKVKCPMELETCL